MLPFPSTSTSTRPHMDNESFSLITAHRLHISLLITEGMSQSNPHLHTMSISIAVSRPRFSVCRACPVTCNRIASRPALRTSHLRAFVAIFIMKASIFDLPTAHITSCLKKKVIDARSGIVECVHTACSPSLQVQARCAGCMPNQNAPGNLRSPVSSAQRI